MDKEKVIIECIKKIKGDYFTETKNLIFGGWLDSFEIVRLIRALEDAFNIKFPLGEVSQESFDSVANIVDIISSEGVGKDV